LSIRSGLPSARSLAFGLGMGQGTESVEGAARGPLKAGPVRRSAGLLDPPEAPPSATLANLLAASAFAAFAALLLAASIILGLPGTEHNPGRWQVTGRVSLSAPVLRR